MFRPFSGPAGCLVRRDESKMSMPQIGFYFTWKFRLLTFHVFSGVFKDFRTFSVKRHFIFCDSTRSRWSYHVVLILIVLFHLVSVPSPIFILVFKLILILFVDQLISKRNVIENVCVSRYKNFILSILSDALSDTRFMWRLSILGYKSQLNETQLFFCDITLRHRYRSLIDISADIFRSIY